MSLFRLSDARPPAKAPQAPPKVAGAPGVFSGPPTAGEVAYRLEHTTGYDGSKLREKWGSPMQFLPADRLPDVQARELVNHLLEQRNV